MVDSEAATRTDLERALSELPVLSAKREKALEERVSAVSVLEEKLALIARQRQDILALSAQILQVWEGIIAVPVIGEITRERANELTERILQTVIDEQARFVILDLTRGRYGRHGDGRQHGSYRVRYSALGRSRGSRGDTTCRSH